MQVSEIKKNIEKILDNNKAQNIISINLENKGIQILKTNKFKLTKDLINSKFFINSKLNFTENILLKNSNQKAITFISENGYREQKSWRELNIAVKKIISFYKKINIFEKVKLSFSKYSAPKAKKIEYKISHILTIHKF